MLDPKAIDILPDLLESMFDSIIIDQNERIIFFSESYARDAGINSSDVIGKKVQDVITNSRLPIVMKTGIEESVQAVSSTVVLSGKKQSITPLHFCNRVPIRKNGDPNNEVIGAFAYSFFADLANVNEMRKQLDALKKQDKLIMEHLNEIYKPAFALDSIKGSSTLMTQLRDLIVRVAPSNLTVTITGETGTGKELIASAIHEYSSRTNNPFIKINCAAIPESLIESELFGYDPGTFTGALKNGKIGKFELANHGTILLDEIGELPLAMQSKLLRVLQEQELERVGGKNPIPLDVRVICSTNRNLKSMVEEGTFRSDLYYRINVVEIQAPPLKDRLDDIPELCEHFVEKCKQNSLSQVSAIEPTVYELLKSYSWPGNIRELEHVIECACVMTRSGTLKLEDFDFFLKRIGTDSLNLAVGKDIFTQQQTVPTYSSAAGSLEDMRRQVLQNEKKTILTILDKCHGNISEAAKQLDISRSSLYRKLKQHKIYPYDK